MRLAVSMVFFSGNPCTSFCLVTTELRRILKSKPGTSYFIPADDHDVNGEYLEATRWMQELGFKTVELVTTSKKITKAASRTLAKAELVFVGGGNTFYLMKHLNSSGLTQVLPEIHHRGGILAGQSAGAIMMTPSIHTASFPHFDRDDNIVGLKRMRGLNLVNFEFFPHYVNRPTYSRSLRRYSRVKDTLVYGSDDNGGIVVSDNRAIFIGNVWGFWGGLRLRVSPAEK